MGMLVTTDCDPTETLPHVFFNSSGSMYWSGLPVSQLTQEIVDDVLHFCRFEGYTQGWNEANWADRELCYKDGPFHPNLLDGAPYRAWTESYEEGCKARLAWTVENKN